LLDEGLVGKKNTVFVKTKDNIFTISSSQTEKGDESTEIPVTITGEDINNCFDCNFLLDAVMSVTGDTITLNIGDDYLVVEEEGYKHLLLAIKFK